MSKHTKGPWANFNGSDVSTNREDGKVSQYIADCAMEELGLEEILANARLIAAAPELLEALVNMVEWHGKREWPTAEFKVESLLPIDLQNDEVRLAMRAITKATGEA